MHTLEERRQIVDAFRQAVRNEFPTIDEYNILIFGSFLTDEYTQHSDIDIGVFSLKERLMYQLYLFTTDYFYKLGNDHDVIQMHLSESQYINVNIILYHQEEVTEYCPEELIEYTKGMIERYGYNPMDTLRQQVVREVGLNEVEWRHRS